MIEDGFIWLHVAQDDSRLPHMAQDGYMASYGSVRPFMAQDGSRLPHMGHDGSMAPYGFKWLHMAPTCSE